MFIFSAYLPIPSIVPYWIHHSHKCQPTRCRESYGQIQDWYNSLNFKSLLDIGPWNWTPQHYVSSYADSSSESYSISFPFHILRSLLGEVASCAPIGIKIQLLSILLTLCVCVWEREREREREEYYFYLFCQKQSKHIAYFFDRTTLNTSAYFVKDNQNMVNCN